MKKQKKITPCFDDAVNVLCSLTGDSAKNAGDKLHTSLNILKTPTRKALLTMNKLGVHI